jgi:hypothetical protein
MAGQNKRPRHIRKPVGMEDAGDSASARRDGMTPLIAFLVGLSAATAYAADAATPGRYVFVPTEAGTLRLDTRTGAVSLCTGTAASLGCRPVSEEDGEPQGKVADRLAALEARVGVLERANDATHGPALKRVAALADRMIDRLVDLVRDVKHPPSLRRL